MFIMSDLFSFATIFIYVIVLFNIVKVKSNNVDYQPTSTTYFRPAKGSYYDGSNEHDANLIKCLKELGEIKEKSGEDYQYSYTKNDNYKKPKYNKKEYIIKDIDSYERDFPPNYLPAFQYEKLQISDIIYPLKHKKKIYKTPKYYPEKKNDYQTKTEINYEEQQNSYTEKSKNNYEGEIIMKVYDKKYENKNEEYTQNYNNEKYEEENRYNGEKYSDEIYQHKEEHPEYPLDFPPNIHQQQIISAQPPPIQQLIQLPPNTIPLSPLPINQFQEQMPQSILIPVQPPPQEHQPEPLPSNQEPPKELIQPTAAKETKIPNKIAKLNIQSFSGTTSCKFEPIDNCSSRAICKETGRVVDCSKTPNTQDSIFDVASQNCRSIMTVPECSREVFCINKQPNWYLIGGNCTRISYSCGLDKTDKPRELCDKIHERINPLKPNKCIDKKDVSEC